MLNKTASYISLYQASSAPLLTLKEGAKECLPQDLPIVSTVVLLRLGLSHGATELHGFECVLNALKNQFFQGKQKREMETNQEIDS